MSNILLIDDDSITRKLLSGLLLTAGYNVVTAEDGETGCRMVESGPFDLVLCDVLMPRGHGYDVLRKMRATPSNATKPFIFLSSLDNKDQIRYGMNLGADDYLCKPVTREELLASVEARLVRRRALEHTPPWIPTAGAGAVAPSPLTLNGGGRLEETSGVNAEATILFADVRGFTRISEILELKEITELLNFFFTRASEVVLQHGGKVDKFVGDGMMAFFSAGRHAHSGLSCALRLLAAAQETAVWAHRRFDGRGMPTFGIGIGVHSGGVRFQSMGGNQNAQLTAIGPAVNTAAQLERETRVLGWDIVVSRATVAEAGAGFVTGNNKTVRLKTGSDVIDVVELRGLDERHSPTTMPAVILPETLKRQMQDNCEGTALMVKKPMTAIGEPKVQVDMVSRDNGPAPVTPVAIKGFRVLEKLGEGGMAAAYLVERESDKERVVLKVFVARENQEEDMLHRFILEHTAISRITHPGIVRIYDQGITDELVYIAMEYFPGGDLKQRIERGLSAQQAVDITRGLLAALAAIHSYSIVHRDIKPANIMFRQDGTPVLLDFGIAKDLESGASLTLDGHIIGSPSYISPEQIRAETCDGRSDLYSLGMMFYEMLTGRKAYLRRDFREVLSDHLSPVIPKLPGPLSVYQPFFEKLVAKAPRDRYAGAAEALAALEKL